MVASLQYAIDYRPYILKNEHETMMNSIIKVGKPVDVSKYSKFNNITLATQPQRLKANSKDVVNYMKILANSVNEMKFSAKTLKRSISRYENNYYKDDDLVKEFIEEDADEFINALNNNFRGTLSTDLTNESMNDYLGGIQELVASNMDIINDLGIDIEKGKAIGVPKIRNFNSIKNNSRRYVKMLDTINENINKVLSKSIYEQIKFDDMKLFVNYSFDTDTEKTFKLFNEGIILDTAI